MTDGDNSKFRKTFLLGNYPLQILHKNLILPSFGPLAAFDNFTAQVYCLPYGFLMILGGLEVINVFIFT